MIDNSIIKPKSNAVIYEMKKNIDFITIYANQEFHNLCGFKKSIVGLKDSEVPSATSEYADDNHYNNIIRSKESLTSLEVHYFDNFSLTACITHKEPTFKPGSSGFSRIPNGIKLTGWKLEDNPSIIELSVLLSRKVSNKSRKKIGSNSLIIKQSFCELSENEMIIMYLTSLGFMSKDIARLLSLKTRTIDDYIYVIKSKYNFSGHKKNLSDYLVEEKNMHQIIPFSFLENTQKIVSMFSRFGWKFS